MSSGGGGSSSSGGGGGGGQSYSPSAGPAGGASAGGNYGGNVNTSQSYGGSTPSNDNGGGGGGGQSYQPPAPVVTTPVAPVPVAPVVPDLPEPTNIYEKIAQDAAIEDANNQVIENIILNNIYDEVALTGGNIAPTPVSVAPTPVAPITVAPTPVAPITVAPTPVAPITVAPEQVVPEQVAPEQVAPEQVAPEQVAPTPVAPITVAPEQVAPTPTAPPSILNPPAPIEPTPIEPTPVVPTAVAPPSILNPPTTDEPLDIEDFRKIPVIDIPTVPLQNPQPVQTLPTAPPSILNPEPIVTEPTVTTAVAPPSILNPEPVVTTDIDRPNIAEITDGVAPIDIDLPVGGGADASQTDFTVPETLNTESGKDSTEAKLDYLTGPYQDIELTDEQKQVLEDQRQEARYAISPMEDPINKAIGYGLSFLFPGAGLLYGAYKNATAMGYSIPNPFEGILGGEPTQENVQSKLNEMNFGGGGEDNQGYVPQTTTTTQTPQSDGSMVNQYFSNLNMGGQSNINTGGQYSLSSDLQISYNNAKSSINNILGINQQSQQFGYSAQPYGSYSRTDLTNNPYYIDYLKQRGLI